MSQILGSLSDFVRAIARAIEHWLQSDGDDDFDFRR